MIIEINQNDVKADARGVHTSTIQQAIDRCHEAGGGIVRFSSGTYVTGTLRLRSRVHLELEVGVQLFGSTDRSDYPAIPEPKYRSLKDSAGFRALIYAEGEEHIGLSGAGTIDGRGAAFAHGGNDMDGRPRLLLFISCRDLRVEGLRLRDSAMWMQHYLDCERVQVRGLVVWNHANRNNDMIDIDGCRQMTVSDCIGDTDDDGITLKSTGAAGCEHIVITNCVVSSCCNAIKLGTESTGGFRNITISNCVVKPTAATTVIFGYLTGKSGISLQQVDGGRLDGVTISNIVIEGTKVPLFIRLGNRGRPHYSGAPKPGVGVLRNVQIQNVVAREAGPLGCSVTGIPGHRVENVVLSQIRVELAEAGVSQPTDELPDEREESYPEATMWGELPAFGFFLRHVHGIRFNDVVVVPAAGEARPGLVCDDVTDLLTDGRSFIESDWAQNVDQQRGQTT